MVRLFVALSFLLLWQAKRAERLSKEASRIVEDAISELCADYAPVVDVRDAARRMIRFHNSSRRILIEKLRRAVKETKRFEVAMAGHSVCAGHGNYFNQSYAMVADGAIRGAFLRAAGVEASVRSYGIGGTSSLPLGWCAADTFGPSPDLVAWDFQMVDGKNWMLAEAFCRAAWSIPSQPLVLLLSKESSRLSMLDTYAASGMPAASMPEPNDLVLGLNRNRKLHFRSKSKQERPHFLQDILIDPRSEVEKRRKFTTPDGAPGRTRWHPGWRVHRLFGAVFAVWLLTTLGDALRYTDNDEVVQLSLPPASPGCERMWWWCGHDPLHECATTYEPKRGRDLRSILRSPSSWPVVLAKGDPGLRADEFGLGYLDKKWTLRGDRDLGSAEFELKSVRTGNLILCEAKTGWRRPSDLGDFRRDLRIAVFSRRDQQILRLDKTRQVDNCYHARFRPSSPSIFLSLNVTAHSSRTKIYLSHVIWR